MTKVAKDVDEYISRAPAELQPALRELRSIIRTTVPTAKETIYYQMPHYNYKGPMVWFGLQSKHIGIYLRPPILQEHKTELRGYTTTKSALHLPMDKKVPASLVKKLVKDAMKKNEIDFWNER
jgi:uncharacterized protein YdhG (YjbR/CyaY superfamily)